MTKSISVIAYHRPQYLRKCLAALTTARRVEKWTVWLSIDGPPDDLTHECFKVAGEFGHAVTVRMRNLGIHDGWGKDADHIDHPSTVIQEAFDTGSQLHLYLEEDSVVAPDALEWVEEEARLHFEFPNCWLVALADDEFSKPMSGYHLAGRVTSPWAWATTPEKWAAIYAKWNANVEHPRRGWDWSLNDQMVSAGAYSIAPNCARARNIGRECGVHGGDATYYDHLERMAWTGSE